MLYDHLSRPSPYCNSEMAYICRWTGSYYLKIANSTEEHWKDPKSYARIKPVTIVSKRRKVGFNTIREIRNRETASESQPKTTKEKYQT